MKPPPLSPGTRRRLDAVFAPADRAAAERLLVRECGSNLPHMTGAGPRRLERVRYAAMKLSGGDLAALREAVDLAKTDWRDLLLAADFGADAGSHQRWSP